MQNPQTQKSELKTLKFGLWCFKNIERRLKRDKTRFKLLSSFRVGIKQCLTGKNIASMLFSV